MVWACVAYPPVGYEVFLVDVAKVLADEGVEYGVSGGYAVTLHGCPRGTLDIDLALDATWASYLVEAAGMAKVGLTARLPLAPGEHFSFRKE